MFKFNLVCEQISFFLIWIFQFIIFINFSIYYSKERIYFFIRTYQSIRLEKRRLLLLLILSIILHAVDKSWGVKHFVQTKWIILREKVQLTFISAKTKKKKKYSRHYSNHSAKCTRNQVHTNLIVIHVCWTRGICVDFFINARGILYRRDSSSFSDSHDY